jgi:hypothetical protein
MGRPIEWLLMLGIMVSNLSFLCFAIVQSMD